MNPHSIVKSLASAAGAFSITPHDTNNLTKAVQAIYIGGSGDIKVEMKNGDVVTFTAVPVGVFPIQVNKVYLTDTTATNIMGLTEDI